MMYILYKASDQKLLQLHAKKLIYNLQLVKVLCNYNIYINNYIMQRPVTMVM